jgi:hypothetical protein
MHGHKTVFNPSLSNTLIPEFSAAFIIEPVPLLAKGIHHRAAPEDLMRKHGVLDRLLLIYEAGTRKFASN